MNTPSTEASPLLILFSVLSLREVSVAAIRKRLNYDIPRPFSPMIRLNDSNDRRAQLRRRCHFDAERMDVD